MAVDTQTYVPLLVSEKLSPNTEGKYDLCRAAVLAMLVNAGTNGEWMTKPNGKRWGRKQIRQLLKNMRRATGDLSRGYYNQSHVPAFLRGAGWRSDVYEQQNVPFASIVDGLRTGKWNYELAGDVKHTALDSPLRRYVNPNVGHDIALIRLSKDEQRIGFIDPMTPPGRRALRWAPVNHFRQFASAFKTGSGNVIAGRVRKGSLTDANMVRKNLAMAIDNARGRVVELETTIDNKQAKVIALRDDKATLVAVVEDQKKVIVLLDAELAEALAEEDQGVIDGLEEDVRLAEDQLYRIKVIADE